MALRLLLLLDMCRITLLQRPTLALQTANVAPQPVQVRDVPDQSLSARRQPPLQLRNFLRLGLDAAGQSLRAAGRLVGIGLEPRQLGG